MNIIQKIEKVLIKKKEVVLFDLYLKDYDSTNFYFAIVMNHKINKYKVLFVPLDAYCENDKIEDYFCYQFIFVDTVNYLIELVDKNRDLLEQNHFIDSYDIMSHIRVKSIDWCFTFKEDIDSKYSFYFDIITTLFEHSPNIVNELCPQLLKSFYN